MLPITRFSLSGILLLFLSLGVVRAQDGFASAVTGGQGGRVVTANTAEELKQFAASEEPLIIQLSGFLETGGVNVASNKSIIGLGSSAGLRGTLYVGRDSRNVIIKNLNITNPMNKKGKGGGDGITIRGGKDVWVNHCTFKDCADGAVDATEGADRVTVSWCKFFYTKQPQHRFTMLAMGPSKKKAKGRLHITLHHNWWAENCGSRMPAARKADVHMYNNYFSCKDNDYCTNARPDTELLSENNYYQDVKNPCYGEGGSKMKTVGNIYDNCTGKIDRKNDDVFKPPYPYTVEKTKQVPEIVKAGAGVR